MDVVSIFSTTYMVPIYFLYGLAFFVMGVAVWLEASRPSALPVAQTLPFLAAFGVLHGAHEWVEMFYLMAPDSITPLLHVLRIVVLTISFALLMEFGLRLLALEGRHLWRYVRWVILSIFLAGMGLVSATWGREANVWGAAADAWCRYSLAVPGAVLAAAGLFRQSRRLSGQQIGIARDLGIVGLAFLLYGVPGQVFVTPSLLPPSTVINSDLFLLTLHVPVQLLRTVAAGTVAVFTVRALRLFEIERQRQIDELNQARLEAQRRLTEEMAAQEKLRRELLRQTVLAQEEERQYIARELHDEAGQALAALSWGLAAVEEALPNHPDEAGERTGELRELTERVMTNLRDLSIRLRPAVLDELGLLPALISYADDCSARFPFLVDVEVTGQGRRMPSEIETTLYRIVQEALTNVAKHARATHASIRLHFNQQEVTLSVSDDGVGMDVESARRSAATGKGWGLAGISERVQLMEGDLDIRSAPGAGTALNVRVPVLRPPSSEEELREPEPVVAGG